MMKGDPSGSLVERLDLAPLGSGPLDGTTFTVKDNIDLAGLKTGYGSPAWRDAHAAPRHNALCVDQILAAGARCVGKVIADEFTYSLDGEQPFFGTPRNAKAPGRIPGGSSSGSASSVAHGIADFSLGTDSGGSVRVPASLCGVWGMRPSLHRISEAGVLPFMPSVSTVGVVARSLTVLDSAMRVLLSSDTAQPAPLERIWVLRDALEIADPAVRAAVEQRLDAIARQSGLSPALVSLADLIAEEITLQDCNTAALRDLQTAEFQSTLGNWIESHAPPLGFPFSQAYENVRRFDRIAALDAVARCEHLFKRINAALSPGTIVVFPTTPVIAPLKGSLRSLDAVMDFYDRTMAITAFSGVARLPELTAPLLTVDEAPVGLSFTAGHYQDEFLLAAVQALFPSEPAHP
jgi:amidase